MAGVLLLPGHVVLDWVGGPRPCSCVADLRSLSTGLDRWVRFFFFAPDSKGEIKTKLEEKIYVDLIYYYAIATCRHCTST